jgi:hypothetical protein
MNHLINISFLLAIFSMNVAAVEPIDEQQVMLYYSIPLGAGKQLDNKHQFGLRFDRVTHEPGRDVHINTLEGKTAALDFRMGYDGVQSIKIRGVDYADYLIARAAEGEQAPVKVEPEAGAPAETTPAATETPPAEGAAAESAPADSAGAETAEAPKEEKGVIQQKLDELPFGVIIGVIIGVGIIAGVGG